MITLLQSRKADSAIGIDRDTAVTVNPPLDTRLLFRQKLKDDNELLQNKAAKAEESEEKLKQHNRRLPLGDGGGGGHN